MFSDFDTLQYVISSSVPIITFNNIIENIISEYSSILEWINVVQSNITKFKNYLISNPLITDQENQNINKLIQIEEHKLDMNKNEYLRKVIIKYYVLIKVLCKISSIPSKPTYPIYYNFLIDEKFDSKINFQIAIKNKQRAEDYLLNLQLHYELINDFNTEISCIPSGVPFTNEIHIIKTLIYEAEQHVIKTSHELDIAFDNFERTKIIADE